jgi:hypothetical protein
MLLGYRCNLNSRQKEQVKGLKILVLERRRLWGKELERENMK